MRDRRGRRFTVAAHVEEAEIDELQNATQAHCHACWVAHTPVSTSTAVTREMIEVRFGLCYRIKRRAGWCRLTGNGSLVVLELLGEPVKTLVETLTVRGASSLTIRYMLAQKDDEQ